MTAPYYKDSFITLFHGDALEIEAWQHADVLITDPPYGMNRGLGRADTKIANDENTLVRDQVLEKWGYTKNAIVFGHWRKTRPENVTHLAIWDKGMMSLGDISSPFATSHEEIYLLGLERNWLGSRDETVLRYKVQRGGDRPEHPTPKPIGLMEFLVNKTQGIIADPFAGSGSTLIAARNLARFAIGVELEEKYCEIIANRLSQNVFHFDF
jgi:site-specific DNA-methyltransferase (adenine-specific)